MAPDAGTRIDPVPSPPDAAGTSPAATAAADPPLEPPGERSRARGLIVGPNRTGSVVQWLPHSGVLVLPATLRPASRSRTNACTSSSGAAQSNIPSVSAT